MQLRGWNLLMRMGLVALGLFLVVVFLPSRIGPARDPAPLTEGIAAVHRPSLGGAAVNATAGAGPQMIVDGSTIWVTYTLTDALDSRIYLTQSHDAGRSFAAPAEVRAAVPGVRLLQPSITAHAPGAPPLLACLMHARPVAADGTYSGPGEPTGQTSLVLLQRGADDLWANLATPLDAPPGSSYSAPQPLVSPQGNISVLFLETQGRTFDVLRCWITPEQVVQTVSDDPSGAPKLGFSGLWAGGTLHVAYADGRDFPNRSAHLYYTSTTDPAQGFTRSRRLDAPVDRFWQTPPQLAADGETLLIGSTVFTQHYFPLAYRDKLRRHKVAGLHQALAWSREPQVWWSRDNGATFHAVAGIDDQDIEVTAGAVFALPRDGQVAVIWSESRPVTRPPDLRWAVAGGLGQRFSATTAFNPDPGDNGAEVLYDAVWLADGALAALYKDPAADGSAGLYLIRSAPVQ